MRETDTTFQVVKYRDISTEFNQHPERFEPSDAAYCAAYLTAYGEPYEWGLITDAERVGIARGAGLENVSVALDHWNHVTVRATKVGGEKRFCVVTKDLGPDIDRYIMRAKDEVVQEAVGADGWADDAVEETQICALA